MNPAESFLQEHAFWGEKPRGENREQSAENGLSFVVVEEE